MVRIGFIINPIAGTGGLVGFRGTDGVFHEAIRKGGFPLSYCKAKIFIETLRKILCNDERLKPVEFVTPPLFMGYSFLKKLENECSWVKIRKIPGYIKFPTTRKDTIKFVNKMLNEYKASLIVFVGGDGTARDLLKVSNIHSVHVVGIPAGVKVYSSVFAYTPSDAAMLVYNYVRGSGVEIVEREVLDINSNGNIVLYGYLKTPFQLHYLQGSKTQGCYDTLDGIVDYILEIMDEYKDYLFLTGPGKTVKSVHERLSLEYTLFGVDAIYQKKLIGVNLDKYEILSLLKKFPKAFIIITPIGGQGVILGRGNHQFDPEVIRLVGLDNIIIVASRCKMNDLKTLRVDTIDPRLNDELKGYRRVIVEYMEEMVVRIE